MEIHDAMESDTTPTGALVFACLGWRVRDILKHIEAESIKAKSMKPKPPKVWIQNGIKQTRIDYDTPSEQNRIIIRCACTARETLDDIEAQAANLRRLHETSPNIAALSPLFTILEPQPAQRQPKPTPKAQPQAQARTAQLGLKL